jgi:hypothetical protein
MNSVRNEGAPPEDSWKGCESAEDPQESGGLK